MNYTRKICESFLGFDYDMEYTLAAKQKYFKISQYIENGNFSSDEDIIQ